MLGDNSEQNKTVEDGTATFTSITGLMEGTKYQVRVVSINEAGPSNSSGTIQEVTNSDCELLVACMTFPCTCAYFYQLHLW